MTISIIPIEHVAEAQPGDDVAALLWAGLEKSGTSLCDQDVVVVTHKLVSKAEGRIVETGSDPQSHRALIEQEAQTILRRRAELVITETSHGFVCANAGVDRSNVAPGWAVLLPVDPDGSAHRIRTRLERAAQVSLGIIITDTFGRAWRNGLVDVAIGVSGLAAVLDLRGTTDTHGNLLQVTEVALADELAAAADLVMGKTAAIPGAIVRGLPDLGEPGRARDLIRSPTEDLFR